MERRQHKRRRFWLPVLVDRLEDGFAVSHDASDGGLLLVCGRRMRVGEVVNLAFRIPPGGPVEVHAAAKVVRVNVNDEDPDGLWPYKVAVQFSEPVPKLEEFLARLKSPTS